jgi:tRNA1Val (adenine37-N6)-methyltransferase
VSSLTHDSIALRGAGIVNITQPRQGVRFTLDSLLLADFCRIKPSDRVLEPGAGTGIISILLGKKSPKARLVADEAEPLAYELLRTNIEMNGMTGRIVPVASDIRYLGRSFGPNAFDVIVANPPYTKTGAGRTSPNGERQMARQDQIASISVWLDLQALLKDKGRYYLVFPAGRLAELLSLLKEKRLEPKSMRLVHPYRDKPASLVLIESVKSGGVGIRVLPPLVVHEAGGGYSVEMRQIYDLP